MKRLILLLLLAAALAVAACGGKTLDTENVEKDIQSIASQGGVESAVECPDEVDDIEKGTEYECTITYGGNENNEQTVDMKVGDNDESEFADQKKVEDEVAIRQLIAETDEEPAKFCEVVSEEVLEQLGGEDCPAQAAENNDSEPANIKSVTIQGDSATVVSDKSTTTLERGEDGGWVITAVEAVE